MKIKYTTSTALATILFAAMGAPVRAADAPAPAAAEADAGEGLNEIIVTAQKRPENLQKTPIAISVMGGQDLVNRHVQSLTDFGDGAIPSLRVAPFFSRPGALIVNIRGVGVLSDSNQPARDQGVGVYIDGIYMGRPQGLGAALYDIQNIEVLKGPQGTLFGRNTEGGAVNIVTKRPSGVFKMNTTFGLGNFSSYKGETHIDLPEMSGISIKLDAVVSHRDGLVKNPMQGQSDFNGYDKRGFHAEILWKPLPDFTVDYAFDTSYDATTTLYGNQISAPTALAASANAPAIVAYKLAAAAVLQPNRVRVAAIGGLEYPSVGKTSGVRLNLEWQALPNIMLKSISSYRHLTQSQFDNAGIANSFVSNPSGVFTGALFQRFSLAYFRQNQVSQELQIIGEIPRVKFTGGALYYQEHVEDNAQAPFVAQFTDAAGSTYTINPAGYKTSPTALDPFVIQRASHVRTTSIGAYGQATYTPPIAGDIVHLTLGARWTRDEKVGTLFLVNGTLPAGINGNPAAPIVLDSHWSRVDPLVNLSLDVTSDIHVYGKFSTGYKSGGANSRSLNYAKFNPETVSMFEAGLKSEFWDRRARLNVAAYIGDYKDIQLDFSGQYEDFVNGVRVVTTRTTTDTVNAPGTGRLKGVEAELAVTPVQGLTLTASYAYNSVHIPDTVNPFKQTINGVIVSVNTAQRIYQVYTPENSASGSIDYEVPLDGFTIRAHLDANYDSGYYGNYTDSLIDPVTREVRYAQPKGDKSFIVNGRLALADFTLGDSDAKMTVAVWARNLFDEEHVFLKSGAPTSGVTGFFNDARTFGVEANIKF